MSEHIKRIEERYLNDNGEVQPWPNKGARFDPFFMGEAFRSMFNELTDIAEQQAKELSAVRTELEELKKRFEEHKHIFDATHSHDDIGVTHLRTNITSHPLKEGETVHFPDSEEKKPDSAEKKSALRQHPDAICLVDHGGRPCTCEGFARPRHSAPTKNDDHE